MKRTSIAIYRDLTGKKSAGHHGVVTEGEGIATPTEKVTETTKGVEQ
jgi:hypothetical protein